MDATSYRAKVGLVAPSWRRDTFEQEEACFLGVSLENSQFTRPKFESMLEWVARRFRRCTLLIGDSMHRITLETTRGLSPEVAEATALQLGRDYIANEGQSIRQYGETEFDFVTCSSLRATAAFRSYHEALWAYFDARPSFRASVESFGRSYHRRGWELLPEEERARRVARSCEYFLEEFAIFAALRDRGLPVMVYPGSFSTLTEIAEGKHDGILPQLSELTIVSLNLRRR